jgi:hypothetical protein
MTARRRLHCNSRVFCRQEAAADDFSRAHPTISGHESFEKWVVTMAGLDDYEPFMTDVMEAGTIL